MSLLLIAALAVQAATAIATSAAIRRPATAARIALRGGIAAALVALAALVDATLRDSDRVGAVLVVFVLAVTALVLGFARANLRGDPAAGRFAALAAWLALASGLVASAADLVAIALAWTAGTVVVIALLGHAGDWGQARIARRRAAVALLVGDAGLWLAVVAVRLDVGASALGGLADAAPATAALAGAGVALAAISRAAAVPFHGWLPASLAAPTPVSALLHAGFVNAGAVLLLRTADLPSPVAGLVAGAAGATTVAIAGTAMLTRPDVKGRLVHSTAAQMGFMLLACAIGAWYLAIFHVMAHGLFKAALFLGSGTVVPKPETTDGAPAPSGPLHPAVRFGAVAVAALAPVAAALALGGATAASAAMLLFTVLAVAVAAGGALGGLAGRPGVAWALAAAAAGVGVAYVLVTHAFGDWLALDAPGGALPWPVVPAVAAVLALLAFALRRSRAAAALYGFALGWARPPLPPADRRRPASAVPSEYGSRP
ncbi:proton-conducting transporter transmembrane domain-containing protein [Agromyces indicus]|uniref:Proton-conducting transporter membrane subunit n=1 Tax=Agromyces indicus TaxID=758919 RepID=A0ABU1FHJ0_9MICO|nr:proton-conducting transporter membrane subunit [Agromyces indicus]MDR5691209.1 proton-conducting transporter membrane subunit [Agromyces indicus]